MDRRDEHELESRSVAPTVDGEGEKADGDALSGGPSAQSAPDPAAIVDGSAPLLTQAITIVDGPAAALTPRASGASSSPHLDAVTRYMATLPSDKSRKSLIETLRRIAKVLSVCDERDVEGNKIDAWKRIPWAHLTARETTYIITETARRYAPETAKLTRHMLRGVLKAAWRLGHMTSEQYLRAADLERIRGQRITAGRALTQGEVERLREHCSGLPTPYNAYVWAVFACGLGGGLRRDEIAGLLVTDLTPAREGQRAAGYLRVLGKGNKERLQPLSGSAWQALQHWAVARAGLGLRTSALFPQLAATGRLGDAPLGEYGIWRLVNRTGQDAGVDHFSPHDLRRTFATRMLDKVDLSTVQNLMGHADIATTVRYDHRGQDHVDAAAELLAGELGTLEGAAEAVAKARAERKAELASQKQAAATADVVAQAKRLATQGYSVAQIATALFRAGIKKKGGTILTAADVRKLIA